MSARITRYEIRQRVRQQIIWAIEADLDGRGEALMKEVWEQLDGDAEFRTADNEMREIIKLLKARSADDAEGKLTGQT